MPVPGGVQHTMRSEGIINVLAVRMLMYASIVQCSRAQSKKVKQAKTAVWQT